MKGSEYPFGLADLERCILSDPPCYPQGTLNAQPKHPPEGNDIFVTHGNAPFSRGQIP